MRVKVENESLVRDTNTNAILETDVSKLHKHRAIKNAIAEREDKIDYLVEKINNLEKIINGMTNGNHNI